MARERTRSPHVPRDLGQSGSPGQRAARTRGGPPALRALGPVGDGAIHVPPQQLSALQRAVGNTAARRVAGGTAPRGPQRLWTHKEFAEHTYESYFTRKSTAQLAVEKLIKAYFALETPKNRPTVEHVNLLAQMKTAAQLWIADHTVDLDDEQTEDPNRARRMQGFKDFLANVDGELSTIKGSLGDEFTEEIGEEHKEFTKLRDYYKGSANSLFTKASKLLGAAVSLPGDEASLEIEFEIPIDPDGVGFIGGRLSVEAEKDDDSMITARTEMVITGGANIGIAKVKAELGGYIEAKAGSAVDVMNLYSYGLYRRFRESKAIPREAANYMWGGQTSSYGYKKAEAWSRTLEQQLFGEIPDPDPNDDKYASMSPDEKLKAIEEDQKVVEGARERVKNTYVETGGIIAGKGEVGISKLVELEVGVQYTSGKKITAESIKAAKGTVGGKNKGPAIRGAQTSLGEDTSSVSFSMAATVGPLEGEFEISKSGGDLEISFDVTGKIPAGALDGVAAYLANVGVSLVRFARTVNVAKEDEVLGPLAALGGVTAALYTPVAGAVVSGDPTSLIGDVGIRLSMSAEREDGEWSGSIELRHVKSTSFEPPIGLKVELEKSERIGALQYSGGKWALK
jgi:hypothetical protein